MSCLQNLYLEDSYLSCFIMLITSYKLLKLKRTKKKKRSIEHGRDYHKQSYALMVFALRLCSHLIIGLRLVSYGLVAEIILGLS